MNPGGARESFNAPIPGACVPPRSRLNFMPQLESTAPAFETCCAQTGRRASTRKSSVFMTGSPNAAEAPKSAVASSGQALPTNERCPDEENRGTVRGVRLERASDIEGGCSCVLQRTRSGDTGEESE